MSEQSAKEDRRVSRTRKLIAEAFISLLEKKPFEELTVADLTEEAEINRSTFYAHYLDKYDLLDKIIDTRFKTLGALLEANLAPYAATQTGPDAPSPYYTAYFEHLQENARFYSIMFRRLEPGAFHNRLLVLIRDSQFAMISQFKLEQKLLVPTDILLDYISSSIIGITVKWFENDQKYSSRYMALQLTRLAALGADRAMGRLL